MIHKSTDRFLLTKIYMNYKEFTKRLFSYLREHLFKLIITSVALILATTLESLIPEITGRIVDDLFIEDRSHEKTILYSLILFSVFVVSSIFSLVSTATSSWVSNVVIMNLRKQMFDKLLRLPKSYFDNKNLGKIISKFTFDVEQIAGAASSIWIDFLKALVLVVILFFYLLYKNWLLSTIILVMLPFIFITIKFSAKRMRDSSLEVQKSMGDINKLLNENITGNTIIKIYGAQKIETKKITGLIQNIRHQKFKVTMSSAFNSNFINILLGLSLAAVVYLSSTYLVMSAGEFLSYFTALAMLIKPTKTLININKPFQVAYSAGKSIFNFLDEIEENIKGTIPKTKINGNIEFKNINFRYASNEPVLKNISFTISPNETIAIVGPTGSGKSTIIDLIMKFYQPTDGEILLDGYNISNLNTNFLRTCIAYVDQEAKIFNDSVMFNISLSDKPGNFDKVCQAALDANASDFIELLDGRYQANIGDSGKLLSGGQRQRLAIARALMKNAPIIILDEATSALDSVTENKVKKAIEKATKNKTTIIIAHRLSTVKNVDKIIVLKDGEIIEEGTHETLIKNNGYYSQVVADQFK